MTKKDFIHVDGAAYSTSDVLAHGSFDKFRDDSFAQAAAANHETLHFGAWGDQREAKMKEVWDAANKEHTAHEHAHKQPAAPDAADAGKQAKSK